MDTLFTLNSAYRHIKRGILKKVSYACGKCLFGPPEFIEIRLTVRCNLRCLQCEEWKSEDRDELTTQRWKEIIDDIKGTIGPFFLRFYGGEPFLRKDLLELMEYARKRGIAVMATTNGTLIDEHVAGELHRIGLLLLNISMDGLSEDSQDRLRGVPGTHKRVLNAIELLKNKVPVQINTTIMDYNIGELSAIAEFAGDNGMTVSFQGYSDTLYRKLETGANINHHYMERREGRFPKDIDECMQAIDTLIDMKKHSEAIANPIEHLERLKDYYRGKDLRRSRSCEAPSSRLMIKEQGNIGLCGYSGPLGIIGNIADKTLSEIWSSETAKDKIMKMKDCDVTDCLIIRGCYKETLGEKFGKINKYLFNMPKYQK